MDRDPTLILFYLFAILTFGLWLNFKKTALSSIDRSSADDKENWRSFQFQIISSVIINTVCTSVCLKHMHLQLLQGFSNVQLFSAILLCSIVELAIGFILLSDTCSYFQKIDISYSYTFHWIRNTKVQNTLQTLSILFSISLVTFLLKVLQTVLQAYCINVYYINFLFILCILLLFKPAKIDIFRNLIMPIILSLMICISFFVLNAQSYKNLLHDFFHSASAIQNIGTILIRVLNEHSILSLIVIVPKVTPALFCSAHAVGDIQKIRRNVLSSFIPLILLLCVTSIIHRSIPLQNLGALLDNISHFNIVYPMILLACVALLIINIIIHLENAVKRIEVVFKLAHASSIVWRYSSHIIATIILMCALLMSEVDIAHQSYLISLFCAIYFGYIACTNSALLMFIGWGANKTKNINRFKNYIVLSEYVLAIGLYLQLHWQLLCCTLLIALLCFARLAARLLSLIQDIQLLYSHLLSEYKGIGQILSYLKYIVKAKIMMVWHSIIDTARQYYPQNYVILYVSIFSICSTFFVAHNLNNALIKSRSILTVIIPSIYTLSTVNIILAVWWRYTAFLIPFRHLLWYANLLWSLLGSGMYMLYISHFANHQLVFLLTNILIFGYLVPKFVLITTLSVYISFIMFVSDWSSFEDDTALIVYPILILLTFMVTFIKSYRWPEIPTTFIHSLDARIARLQSTIIPPHGIKKNIKAEILYKQSQILDVFGSEVYKAITQHHSNIDKDKLNIILNSIKHFTTQVGFYVQNVLNVSKAFIKDNKKTVVDISALLLRSIQESVTLDQNEHTPNIKTNITSGVCLKCDQEQVAQIYLNVLLSAISLSKKHHEIHVILKKNKILPIFM